MATDTYYSLAVARVPIAEQLVMSWRGCKQTVKGRDTFRTNYLGRSLTTSLPRRSGG